MADIEYLEPPLIKEILAQQRMILEMQRLLLELLSHPSLVYKDAGTPKQGVV